jgi:hypothetical protein
VVAMTRAAILSQATVPRTGSGDVTRVSQETQ